MTSEIQRKLSAGSRSKGEGTLGMMGQGAEITRHGEEET
jgi:hypothetical protein